MEHTPSMLSETHTQRILDLASQRGLLRASDLDAIGSPRVILTRMTAAGLLERIGRGLYRLPGAQVTEFESLALVATRVPQAVFCLLTALQFHGLTTQLPRQVWIAMPRGSHSPRIDYPPIRMVQMAGSAHLAGVEEHLCNGVKVRIYSPAKTVVDCFKHRNKIGLSVAIEGLQEALRQRKTTPGEIVRQAERGAIATVIRPYLEALTANGNVEQLARDALQLKARLAVTADPARYTDLKACLAGTGIEAALRTELGALREDEAAVGDEPDNAHQADHHHCHHHQSLALLATQYTHRATASRLRYSSTCSV